MNDRENVLKTFKHIKEYLVTYEGRDNDTIDACLFMILVWMDGMSGYLDKPPKCFSKISGSSDKMMHDEFFEKRKPSDHI